MAQRPDLEMDSDPDDRTSSSLAKEWIQQRYEDTSKIIFHQQQEQIKLEGALVRRKQAMPTFPTTNWYRNYGNTAMYMVARIPSNRVRTSSHHGYRTSTVSPVQQQPLG